MSGATVMTASGVTVTAELDGDVVAEPTAYFLVPSPGRYGDSTRVLAAYVTRAEALAAARRGGVVVRRGHAAKGERFLRAYEQICPVVSP